DGTLDLEVVLSVIDGDLLRQVAIGDCGGDLGDVPHLGRQVAGHRVHTVGQILPRASHALDHRLAAELPFGAYLASHAGHFRGEGPELVHHRVDGVFQLLGIASCRDGDFLAQVAVRGRRGDVRDISHLVRQVTGHRVHVVGEIFPRAGHARNHRLTAQLPFGAYLAGHAGNFRGEGPELVHHRVDGVFQLQNLAANVYRDFSAQIAISHGGGDVGDVSHLTGEVRRHRIDAVGQIFPRAGYAENHSL